MIISECKKIDMNFKDRAYILFDLDGTLTQSHEGIINAIKYSLEKVNISFDDKNEEFFREFIGPPLDYSYKAKFGMDDNKIDSALKYFKEYYDSRGSILENSLYDGVYNMLEALANSGKKIVLASSKPMEPALSILKHFKIYDFFYFIGAADERHNRNKKTEVLQYIIDNCKGITAENSVMVGDRVFDVKGSGAFNIDCIAVRYGYASEKELEYSKPALIVDTVLELKDALI